MAAVSVTSDNLTEFVTAKVFSPEAIAEAVPSSKVEKPAPKEAKEPAKVIEESVKDLDRQIVDQADEATPDEPKEEPKKKTKLESRFSELTEQRKAAEARAAAAEARALEAEAKLKPAPDPIAKAKPDPKDYTDAFKYAEDLAQYSVKEALREKDESDKKAVTEREREKAIKTWRERVEQVKTARPDWADLVASSKASVSDAARDSLVESEYGPHILGDLAADDELADKVSAMKPVDQVKWIGRMEAKYESQAEAKEEPEAKAIVKDKPKAPVPINPVRATRATEEVDGRGEWTGSFKDYKASRLRQINR